MNRPFVSFLLTLSFKRGANKSVIKRLSESKTKSRMTSNGIRSYVLMLFLRVFYMDNEAIMASHDPKSTNSRSSN